MSYQSTKIIELGSCAFRQWRAEGHCKFIHGYRLIAKFWFECDFLDEKNWVVDFGGLKELKSVLEKQFDHTLCIAGDDPSLDHLKALHTLGVADLRIMEKGVGIERTAEWCFDVADAHVRGITKNRCRVDKVEVWEHDKNSAIFTMKNVDHKCDNKPKIPTEQFEFKFNEPSSPSPQAQTPSNAPQGARVGNQTVTTGWGNPFGGTSWGA